MNKRQKKKNAQKLCMYFCMNAYLLQLSGNDTDKLIQNIKLILLKQETEA